jgi:hypothetical protein
LRDDVFGYIGGADHGHEHDVLVRNIQLVKGIEGITPPSGKHLKSLENILHGLAGRLYSVARTLKTGLGISGREFDVAILSAAIDSDYVPSKVVERGMKVVDSIAYYECPVGWDRLSEVEAYDCLSRRAVVAHRQGVRLGVNESGKLRLEVADVMVGPFEFGSSSFEHSEAP